MYRERSGEVAEIAMENNRVAHRISDVVLPIRTSLFLFVCLRTLRMLHALGRKHTFHSLWSVEIVPHSTLTDDCPSDSSHIVRGAREDSIIHLLQLGAVLSCRCEAPRSSILHYPFKHNILPAVSAVCTGTGNIDIATPLVVSISPRLYLPAL